MGARRAWTVSMISPGSMPWSEIEVTPGLRWPSRRRMTSRGRRPRGRARSRACVNWWGTKRRRTPASAARRRSTTRAAVADHARPRVCLPTSRRRPPLPQRTRTEATGCWLGMTRTFVVGDAMPEHAEPIVAQQREVRGARGRSRRGRAGGSTGSTCTAPRRTSPTPPVTAPSAAAPATMRGGFQFALGLEVPRGARRRPPRHRPAGRRRRGGRRARARGPPDRRRALPRPPADHRRRVRALHGRRLRPAAMSGAGL